MDLHGVNSAIESVLELDSQTIDDLLYELEFLDLSDGVLNSVTFVRMLENNSLYSLIKNTEDALLLLKKMVEQGLDLNDTDGSDFNYGHHIMRSCNTELIEQALQSGFKFDSYTKNPWHSLELIQMNYFGRETNQTKMLEIIQQQLSKGVDLSKSDPKDMLTKLNRGSGKKGWDQLIEVYRNDPYLNKYINDNFKLIVDNELFGLIPKDATDIFLF